MVFSNGILMPINIKGITIVEIPIMKKGALGAILLTQKLDGNIIAPTYTGRAKEYILILVFFLLVIISIYMVKLIFRYELFSKLTASLTGGTMASEAVFAANQVVNNVKANM